MRKKSQHTIHLALMYRAQMNSSKIGNLVMPNSFSTIILHLKEKSNNVQRIMPSLMNFTISEKLILNVHNQFIIKVYMYKYKIGNCSSSYSIAAVSATSDRLCLSRNGEF